MQAKNQADFVISQEMKDFLDYLQGNGTKNDFTRRIDAEVKKARVHEEWKVEYMSLFLRDQEKFEEGHEKGIEEKTRITIINMLNEKEPLDKICRIAECKESYVKAIQEELKLNNK